MSGKEQHGGLRGEDRFVPSKDFYHPQFDPANCKCQCRVGGLFGNSDEGGEDDTDADESFLNGDEGADQWLFSETKPLGPIYGVKTRFDSRYADFEVGREGFRFGSGHMIFEDPFRAHAERDGQERFGSPDSLVNHFHSSGNPSPSSSGYLTQRSHSPGPVLHGVGRWADWTPRSFTTSRPPSPNTHWQRATQVRHQRKQIAEDWTRDEHSERYAKAIRTEDLEESGSID